MLQIRYIHRSHRNDDGKAADPNRSWMGEPTRAVTIAPTSSKLNRGTRGVQLHTELRNRTGASGLGAAPAATPPLPCRYVVERLGFVQRRANPHDHLLGHAASRYGTHTSTHTLQHLAPTRRLFFLRNKRA